jgi:hypothetical protein
VKPSPGTVVDGSGLAWTGLPAAVRYREWQVNRGLYVLGFVATLAPWVLLVIGILNSPGVSVRLFVQDYLTPQYSFSFGTVAAGVVGVGLLWRDRVRGALLTILEGPVRRLDVLMAKVWLGATTVTLANVVLAAAMTIVAIGAGDPGWVGAIWLKAVLVTSIGLSLFGVALAMGTAMGSLFLHVVGAGLWALWPILAGNLLNALAYPPLVANSPTALLHPEILVPPHWLLVTLGVLFELSPFPQTFLPGWPGLLDSLWFLAVSVGFILLARVWWQRAREERMQDPFFFPVLWNYYYAVLALFTGFITTGFLFHGGGPSAAGFFPVYGVVSAVEWFGWRWALSQSGRAAPWRRGPVA